MKEILAALRAQGADVAGAMERFVGDEQLYGQCLRLFAGDPGFRRLKELVGQARCGQEAFDCAHTLKGVAANLGLNELAAALASLVNHFRGGQTGEEADARQAALLLDGVMGAFDRFTQAINGEI